MPVAAGEMCDALVMAPDYTGDFREGKGVDRESGGFAIAASPFL
jgi:hypothetical protein